MPAIDTPVLVRAAFDASEWPLSEIDRENLFRPDSMALIAGHVRGNYFPPSVACFMIVAAETSSMRFKSVQNVPGPAKIIRIESG